jgi:hypothetical protein
LPSTVPEKNAIAFEKSKADIQLNHQKTGKPPWPLGEAFFRVLKNFRKFKSCLRGPKLWI